MTDKPKGSVELLDWLGFVLGSASFGGKADRVRAILTDYDSVVSERDALKGEVEHWQGEYGAMMASRDAEQIRAEEAESALAVLREAAMRFVLRLDECHYGQAWFLTKNQAEAMDGLRASLAARDKAKPSPEGGKEK